MSLQKYAILKEGMLTFAIVGEHGAVNFSLIRARPPRLDECPKRGGKWMPSDLGFHRRTQEHEYQNRNEDCNVLGEGHSCYYDGTGLGAIPVVCEVGRSGGSIWDFLEERYLDIYSPEIQAAGRVA